MKITEISKRGNVIIIQLQYTYKPSRVITTVEVDFGADRKGGKEGHATILDANGDEFVIAGSKITPFLLYSKRRVKVMSLKFKSDKKIIEPFDLTLKAYNYYGRHGEITLFDLNSADFSSKKSNNPDVK